MQVQEWEQENSGRSHITVHSSHPLFTLLTKGSFDQLTGSFYAEALKQKTTYPLPPCLELRLSLKYCYLNTNKALLCSLLLRFILFKFDTLFPVVAENEEPLSVSLSLSFSLPPSKCLLHCLVLILQNLFSLPRIKVLSLS